MVNLHYIIVRLSLSSPKDLGSRGRATLWREIQLVRNIDYFL
jgi:hypothetical protein